MTPGLNRYEKRKNEVAEKLTAPEKSLGNELAEEREADPGVYGAEGDPYTYEVLASGEVAISKGGEVLDTVSPASGMGRAVMKQIAQGQLQMSPADLPESPREEELPYAEDRIAGFSEAAAGKPKTIRDRIEGAQDLEAPVDAESDAESEEVADEEPSKADELNALLAKGNQGAKMVSLKRGLTEDKKLASAKKAMKEDEEDEEEDKDKDKEGEEEELTLEMLKGGA